MTSPRVPLKRVTGKATVGFHVSDLGFSAGCSRPIKLRRLLIQMPDNAYPQGTDGDANALDGATAKVLRFDVAVRLRLHLSASKRIFQKTYNGWDVTC
jgi:hypothetical protein